jgi:type IV secretion system protein VirD4
VLFRSHKDALVLDPFNPDESVGIDPFEMLKISEENFLINARQLALALIPLSDNVRDQFWIKSARNILTAGIIHYFLDDYSFTQTMEIMLESDIKHLRERLANSPNPEVRKYINQLRGVEDKTISGVYSELSDRCMIFGVDQKLMQVLSKKPSLDMKAYSDPSKPPPKLFLRIPQGKNEYYSNFINLFFTFLITALEMRPEGQGEKLIIFFDEVAEFNNLHKLPSALNTIAGKNVILALYMQSLSQFNQHYGENETKTMINNCDTRIIIRITDPDTQSYFSRMIGTVEVKRESQSANYDIDTGLESGRGSNSYIAEIPIVKPESMAYLADKRETIFLSGKGYCKVKHTGYYETDEFGQKEPDFFEKLLMRNKHASMKNSSAKVSSTTTFIKNFLKRFHKSHKRTTKPTGIKIPFLFFSNAGFMFAPSHDEVVFKG